MGTEGQAEPIPTLKEIRAEVAKHNIAKAGAIAIMRMYAMRDQLHKAIAVNPRAQGLTKSDREFLVQNVMRRVRERS